MTELQKSAILKYQCEKLGIEIYTDNEYLAKSKSIKFKKFIKSGFFGGGNLMLIGLYKNGVYEFYGYPYTNGLIIEYLKECLGIDEIKYSFEKNTPKLETRFCFY